MGDGEAVVAVSAGHTYVGVTRGSCIVSSVADVLGMSVMRGVDGVCEICMCLVRGGMGGKWIRGLFLQYCENRGVCNMCLCLGCGSVDGVGGLWMGARSMVWEGGVVSLDYLCIWQVQESVYCARRIPAHLRCTVFNPVAPHQYLLPTVYLAVVDITNPDLFVCGYEKQYQQVRMCQKTVNRVSSAKR